MDLALRLLRHPRRPSSTSFPVSCVYEYSSSCYVLFFLLGLLRLRPVVHHRHHGHARHASFLLQALSEGGPRPLQIDTIKYYPGTLKTRY